MGEDTCDVTVGEKPNWYPCGLPAVGFLPESPGWSLCEEHWLLALVSGWNPAKRTENPVSTDEPQVWRVVSDQPDALKLIATWPRVGRDFTEQQMARIQNGKDLGDSVVARWQLLTRVYADDIREWWPTLVGNEIILPGGKVDPGIEELMDLTMTLGLKK